MENVLCINPKVDTKTEEQVLALIKNMAVVPVAMGVRRADLLTIKQDSNKTARAFTTKIQGRAATCAFSSKCPTLTCGDKNEDESEKHLLQCQKITQEYKGTISDLLNSKYEDIFSEDIKKQISITKMNDFVFKTRERMLDS